MPSTPSYSNSYNLVPDYTFPVKIPDHNSLGLSTTPATNSTINNTNNIIYHQQQLYEYPVPSCNNLATTCSQNANVPQQCMHTNYRLLHHLSPPPPPPLPPPPPQNYYLHGYIPSITRTTTTTTTLAADNNQTINPSIQAYQNDNLAYDDNDYEDENDSDDDDGDDDKDDKDELEGTLEERPQTSKKSIRRKKNQAVRKPPNSWILYRRDQHQILTRERRKNNNKKNIPFNQGDLSKQIALQWRNESPQVKETYKALAIARKIELLEFKRHRELKLAERKAKREAKLERIKQRKAAAGLLAYNNYNNTNNNKNNNYNYNYHHIAANNNHSNINSYQSSSTSSSPSYATLIELNNNNGNTNNQIQQQHYAMMYDRFSSSPFLGNSGSSVSPNSAINTPPPPNLPELNNNVTPTTLFDYNTFSETFSNNSNLNFNNNCNPAISKPLEILK